MDFYEYSLKFFSETGSKLTFFFFLLYLSPISKKKTQQQMLLTNQIYNISNIAVVSEFLFFQKIENRMTY